MNTQQGKVFIKKAAMVRGERVDGFNLSKLGTDVRIRAMDESDFKLFEYEGSYFLRVNSEEVWLTQEPHKSIAITTGNYEIGLVKDGGNA